MTEEPLVSVIIPNYNYGHFLADTVNSVLEQTYAHIECIVVDDGSTDHSKEIIDKLAEKDRRVKPVFKHNGGLSSARNAGINAASGNYLAFLDSDDLWKKEKIANQLNCMRQFPGTNFVFSNYEGFYEDGSIEPFHHQLGNTEAFDFIKMNPIAGSASSALLTSELVKKTGYFDETLRSTEDLDYWFRSVVAGAKIRFCDHYDVQIRLHRSSMSKNTRRMNENNFKVLTRQLSIFPNDLKTQNIDRFNAVVNSKMQSILWVARDNKDKQLILKIYRLHAKFLGWAYTFSHFMKKNFVYDLRVMINLN